MLLLKTLVLLSIGAGLSSLMALLTAYFFFNLRNGKIQNELVYAFLFVLIPVFIGSVSTVGG
ncbi:MAG: hypothetical protein Q4E36_06645 [Bacillota bacterium]|nr:hypothetical protein [Bacillota bacterium]